MQNMPGDVGRFSYGFRCQLLCSDVGGYPGATVDDALGHGYVDDGGRSRDQNLDVRTQPV